MSEAEMLRLAEPQFSMSPRLRSGLMAGFGSRLDKLSMEEVSVRLGLELDESKYQRLLEVESPFNDDLDALGTLYVGDYGQALRDTWVNGLYHFEEPLVDGTFRKALPGESRMKFPGKALYFTIDEVRYPHLAEITDKQFELIHARKAAVERDARAIRGQ